MRRFVSSLLAMCSVAWVALEPATSHADTMALPKALRPSMWKHGWPTPSRVGGVATLASSAATLAPFRLEPPRGARWQGGIRFDEQLSDRFRLRSAEAASRGRAWTHLPLFTAPLAPLVIDPLVASWLARGNTRAALNLELVGAEAPVIADRRSTDVLAGLGAGYAIPTLLHYAYEDTNVALSIAPGSPCTGACLKLAGSF
jgi:hypothetical protein